MPQRTRTGFTLVEMLVVIAIIGILAALLLPAVQAARESARRAQCLNNLSQLGLAAINFEGDKGRFPGRQEYVAIDRSFSQPGGNKPASWAVLLFPYIERQDVFDRWDDPGTGYLDSNRLVANPDLVPYIDNLVCPSRVGSDRNAPSTSYVANGGYSGIDQGGGDAPENGIFLNQIGRQLPGSYRVARPVRMAHLRDGSSATILFSENLPNDLYWHACSNLPIDPSDPTMDYSVPDHTGSDPTRPLYVSYDLTSVGGATAPRYMNTFYFRYTNEAMANDAGQPAVTLPFADIYRINGEKAFGPTVGVNGPAVARPSSNHRGGVNAVFADKHTEFLADGIEYTVLQQLMTPNGLRSSMPRNRYLLKDADYKQ